MKQQLEAILHQVLEESRGEVAPQEKEEFGHYTTAIAMQLAKERGQNPRVVAEDLARGIHAAAPDLFERIDVAGPGFINMWVAKNVLQREFETVSRKRHFGMNAEGKGEKVIVEYSSPNIAKEMHAGHLRNNSLGEALVRLHQASGYEVIRWNYVGDWGTQFGKIIAAYKMWKDEVDLGDHPIEQLDKLYVRFNAAAKLDPELMKRGAEEFRKLESGDPENRELWNQFRTASLLEMEGIYRRYDIRFDEYIGESFFEDQMEPLTKELLEKGVAEFSEGAVIIKLDAQGLPPALIRKSDGASLYITRDIAALRYRKERYQPKRLLYVIGNEQTLQFQQLFAIGGMLGLDEGLELRHVKYGLLLGADGGKMSSRTGDSVSILSITKEAVERAKAVVVEKNPTMSEGEQREVAEAVGLGALKYYMLREARTSDIRFDWDKILDFKGDSGPYLMYTYARLKRLIAKADGLSGAEVRHLETEHELRLIRKLFQFPDEVRRSVREVMTNNLTTYLYELANLINRFYEDQPILTDTHSGRRAARLLLADTAARLLAEGLNLLGIGVLESI